jgi:hypothetical protein
MKRRPASYGRCGTGSLKARFADPAGAIERDVANLLSDLGQKGLLS